MKIINLFYIFFIVIITGCEEIIDLDLPHNNPRIVVEALLTDENEPSYVKLSYTQKYDFTYEQDRQTYVSNALVIIHENTGISDTLTEISDGTYLGHTDILTGSPGNSYWLEIYTTDGKHYISDMETLVPVAKISSMYYDRDYNDISTENPDYFRFNVYIDWQDPANEKNYYLRKFSYFWYNTWHDNIHWNWVFTDKYFDGIFLRYDKIISDYGGKGFKIRLDQYSLTKQAYDFWILVHNQTALAVNPYVNSSIPIIGNIYNADEPDDYALGYFQVSALETAEVWINN